MASKVTSAAVTGAAAAAATGNAKMVSTATALVNKGISLWLLQTCSTELNLNPALKSCFYPKNVAEVETIYKIHESKLHRCLLASEFMVAETNLKKVHTYTIHYICKILYVRF